MVVSDSSISIEETRKKVLRNKECGIQKNGEQHSLCYENIEFEDYIMPKYLIKFINESWVYNLAVIQSSVLVDNTNR